MALKDRREEIIRIFSIEIRNVFKQLDMDYNHLQEIRLRVHAPICCIYKNKECYVTQDGHLSENAGDGWVIGKKEIQETVEYIGNYSLYAYEEEVRQGFITIQGGHRIGVAGRAIVEKGWVKGLKYISYLNIRLSHEVIGCADTLLPYITEERQMFHTLIISPPRCGKTTLLRDCIRQLSNGTGKCPGQTVGVVDERSEIGGSYLGVPQNDLGIRTDVLDCCPKTEGILMLVRSMAPQIIAVDEIGSKEEARALEMAIHTGCRLLATVHGSSMEDIRRKPVFQRMLEEKQIERYVILSNRGKIGRIEQICDGEGRVLLGCSKSAEL